MATQHRATNVPPVNGKLAERSCLSCKLRKRKCTRELPQCRLCIRGNRPCSYQSIPESEVTAAAVSKKTLRNDFLVALFLDPTLFNCCAPQIIPRHHLTIPSEVEHVLGDNNARRALATEYFQKASHWMPIISRLRFFGSLMDSLRYTDPGFVSILLAMKLTLSCPEEVNVCSEVYVIVKKFLLQAEMAGYLNMCTIQSNILIAMYEMGHAIFPGAFTTISTCARYATALGIDRPLSLHGQKWLEQEERNRTWWAIVILDRSINLGFRGQHLCQPDPHVESILPVDDNAWDQGVLPTHPSRDLLSRPSLEDGHLARLAQSINLLSQVFRLVSNHVAALSLDLGNITQLERTLFALENLSLYEELERNICCLSAVAICYSSILLLRIAYLSEPQENSTEDGREQSRRAIREVLAKTLGYFERFRNGWGSLEVFPPFALDWLYRSSVGCILLACHDKLSDLDAEMLELKTALELVGRKWRAAAHYLRLLETRQAVQVPL